MKRILIILIVTALAASCDLPEITVGSMELSIGDSVSRSILPEISMDPHSYRISGLGPGEHTFSLETLKSMNVIEDLTPGNWLIEAEALNESGQVIGSGSGAITIYAGETTSADITVTPLDGTGNLELSLIWEPEDLSTAYIFASLLPPGGTAFPLDFNGNGEGSAAAAVELEAGYYTLLLQLLDTDTVVTGSAETVRIVAGETTRGFFDFSDVNSLNGSGEIGIDVDLNEPIGITLYGAYESITYGSSMTVTASSPGETELISYDWYLNGFPLGSGESVSFGWDLDTGIYRLDVIALNGDLTRSGSLNHIFRVNQP